MAKKKPIKTVKTFSPGKLPSAEQLARQSKKRAELNARVIAAGKLAAKIRQQDTLKQKAAVKRKAEKAALATPKQVLLPLAKPISMRDLPIRGKSLAQFFIEYEKDPAYAAAIESLKKPDEKWAFQFDDETGVNSSSVTIFENLALMEDTFNHYVGRDALERQANSIFKNRSKSRRFFNKIKLVRWNESATQWRHQAHANTVKRRKITGKKNRRKK